MTGAGHVVVTCPNCQGDVDVELRLSSRPLRLIGDRLVVTVTVGDINHDCPPPPAREPLERVS